MWRCSLSIFLCLAVLCLFSCLTVLSIIYRLCFFFWFFLWLQLLPMRWREVSLFFSLSFWSLPLSLSLLSSFHCFSPSLISCALFILARYLILSNADVTCCIQSCSLLAVHVLDVQRCWVWKSSSHAPVVILLAALCIHVITLLQLK